MPRKPNSTTFKPGDPRASAAGKRPRAPRPKTDDDIWEQIKAVGPAALEAVAKRINKHNDIQAARLILDRVAPADFLKDVETQEIIKALEASNDGLIQENERLRTEVARLKAEQEFLHGNVANEAISKASKADGKRAPDNRTG